MTSSTSGSPEVAGDGPLSFAIFNLARVHRAHAAGLLRELGLHPGQELLLMQLLDRDEQTQSELLEAVGLDHSTVSKSLRRMQEAGLLIRRPAEHDRRVQLVTLTDAGRALRQPLERMWADLERISTQGLSPQEITAFIHTAETIRHSMLNSSSPKKPTT
ncbi:MarR family winged helix-turn-helix transcriptional regulator [Actinocorallia populi]|uniref:MarR family winged helix-turn-helix transcriptional regulator n=1 Tax=Actinocorallia populi TaxID=2079200 RepID=UPI000D08D04B|nr:MarR family winged helix-turn-helix transcriptional regulator [Actinocorallia populi]